MGRKVSLSAGMMLIVMLSAALAGGQVGPETGFAFGTPAPGGGVGFLWWGTHEPIYIYGDDEFTVENGVLSGCGTEDDPYIIEGWRIDAPHVDYGFYIDHTTAHFVIRDCIVERARIAGVYLNSVCNGRIEGVQIGISDVAIHLMNSDCNAIRNSVIADCCYGIVMAADSEGNTISGNSFFGNGQNGVDEMRANRWCDGGVGNYWSDYVGCDRNGDGIGDVPYFPLRDSCPLTAPRVEWTGVTTANLSYTGTWIAPDGSMVVTSQTPIALEAVDPGCGLAEIRYVIDYGEWTVYDGPIYLSGDDGLRRICYYGVDRLGNCEPIETVSFILDNHPPQTVLEAGQPAFVDDRGTWITSMTPITLRRTQESNYGRTITYFRVNSGGWRIYDGPFVLHAPDGTHQISYYSRNASGVAEALQLAVLIKDDTPPSSRGRASGLGQIQVVVGAASDAGTQSSSSTSVGTETTELNSPVTVEPESTPLDETTQPETTEPEETQPANAAPADSETASDVSDEPSESVLEEPEGASQASEEESESSLPAGDARLDVQTPTATLPEETPQITPDTQATSDRPDDVDVETGDEPDGAQTDSETSD